MAGGLDSVLAALHQEFIPRLRELGFKGSGKNFRRVRGETINAINIQGSSTSVRFYVNLGLHLSFLPAGYRDEPIPAGKIKEIDCEFRWRLHPQDNWKIDWSYGGSGEESAAIARNVLQAYLDYGEPAFQRFPTAEVLADAIPLDRMKSGKWNVAPLTGTEIRFILTFARIHSHLGDRELARQFAELGLSRLGSATGLLADFQELADG